MTKDTVEKVVLHPLTISRTDVGRNPQPLIVVWAGPIVGVAAPLAIWGLLAAIGASLAWLARFFAGFCCLANGLYIGMGSFDRVGDADDMLRHGTPIWALWLFGLIVAPLGLVLWNGLGPKFGWGRNAEPVSWTVALGCTALLLATLVVELLLSPT